MQTYEIAIYNQQVRELVLDGERHKRYDDSWADIHYIEFRAETEAGAITKCGNKYPQEDGFVIEAVSEV